MENLESKDDYEYQDLSSDTIREFNEAIGVNSLNDSFKKSNFEVFTN